MSGSTVFIGERTLALDGGDTVNCWLGREGLEMSVISRADDDFGTPFRRSYYSEYSGQGMDCPLMRMG